MEIEVGEFVRTRNQGIKRVDIIFENKTVNKYGHKTDSDWDGKWYSYIKTTDIVKHSKHIIDLIEEGDYVNGKEVHSIGTSIGDFPIINYKDGTFDIDKNIKTILTHEVFKRNCYRVEEK